MRTFENLEEVKQAIEIWFKTLGYDTPDRAEKQYLKVIAEVGEVADAMAKEDLENLKSEIGDVFVTVVGYNLMKSKVLDINCIDLPILDANFIEEILKCLIYGNEDYAISYLYNLCRLYKLSLLDCTTIAYNKIQGRLERGELEVVNGTVIKSGK